MKYSVKRKQPQRLDRFGWGDPHAADCFLHPGARAKFNPNHAPAGTPEGGQFASADGGPRNISEAASSIARREVVELGKKDSREHIVAIDSKTGKFIMHGDGEDSEVRVDNKTQAKLEKPGQAIDIVHNHPPIIDGGQTLGSSLSPPDVESLRGLVGERSVTAVTHDGSYFTATRGDKGQQGVSELFSVPADENMPPQLAQLFGLDPPPVVTAWKTMNTVTEPALDSGKISRGDAEAIGFHAMWIALAKEGYINYDYHLEKPFADVVQKNQAVIDDIVRHVTKVV